MTVEQRCPASEREQEQLIKRLERQGLIIDILFGLWVLGTAVVLTWGYFKL